MRLRYASLPRRLAALGLFALLPAALHAQPRPAPASARGIVVTERGVPIAGARVVAVTRTDAGADTVRATTDRAGVFAFASMPARMTTFTASASGYADASQRDSLVAGRTASLVFRLSPAAPTRVTVAGVAVHARTGAPVGSAVATLLDGERTLDTDTSDARGAFSLDGPVSGEPSSRGLSVRVAATGFRTASVYVPSLSVALPLVVRLEPVAPTGPARLAGRITGSGRPLTGAIVTLARLDSVRIAARVDTTGADGLYAFGDLTAGPYVLTAAATGFETRRTDVRLAGGESETRSLDLRAARPDDGGDRPDSTRTATVAGTVVTDSTGTPVARARIVLMRVPSVGVGRSMGHGVTDSLGAFRIAVAPGRYLASVTVHGTRGARPYTEFYLDAATPDAATPVEATAGQTTAIRVSVPAPPVAATVSLSGRVTDAAGAPLAGASVWIAARDARHGVAAARTAADGTWTARIETTVPATFSLLAQRDGYLPEYYREAARADSATAVRIATAPFAATGLDFTLAARPPRVTSGTLAGTVTAGAAPLAGATVVAYGRGTPLQTTTGTDGGYAFAAAPAGPAIVLATADGFAPAYAPAADTWLRAARTLVGPTTARADVALAPFVDGSGARRILGTVRDRRDRPTAAALVRAFDAERRLAAHALADSAGRFVLDGLSDGRYLVTAELPFGSVWSADVEVDSVSVPTGVVSAALDADLTVLDADDADGAVAGVALDAVSPNPARGAVRIAYRLDTTQAVVLRVYDALGRLVATVDAGLRAGGSHEATLGADALAPGVYVVRLDAAGQTATRTFVVAR